MTKKPKKIGIEANPTEADILRGDQTLKEMLKAKPKLDKDMLGQSKNVASSASGDKSKRK